MWLVYINKRCVKIMCKTIIECPNCGMSNLVVIDIIIPQLQGSFMCTECEKEFKIYSDTKTKIEQI